MYPFERFTDMAKRTLTLAQDEAERSRHSYIGTEHMLLGLLSITESAAGIVLARHGVEKPAVQETIEAVLSRKQPIIIKQIIPTSRVKKVIELAFEEARADGLTYVGTGQLLLGLLIEGEGIAAHVLNDLGVTAEKARAGLAQLRGMEGDVEVAPLRPEGEPQSSSPLLRRRSGGPPRADPVMRIAYIARDIANHEGRPPGAIHLLLALLRHSEGAANAILEAAGVPAAALERLSLLASLPPEVERLDEEILAAAKAVADADPWAQSDPVEKLSALQAQRSEAFQRWRDELIAGWREEDAGGGKRRRKPKLPPH